MAVLQRLPRYLYFNHSAGWRMQLTPAPVNRIATKPEAKPAEYSQSRNPPLSYSRRQRQTAGAGRHHGARARPWVQVSADGKITFTGTLAAERNQRNLGAEQVKLVTGNAGGLTISLNGKTLEPLGPTGQVRVVRLTAEGPQFLSKARPPRARSALAARAGFCATLRASRSAIAARFSARSAISNSWRRRCLVRISTLRQNLLKYATADQSENNTTT